MCILFFVILKTMALLKYGFVQSIIIKKFGCEENALTIGDTVTGRLCHV